MPQVGEHILHRRFSIGTRAGDKGMDGFCRPFSPIMVLGQSLDWICLQRLCCQLDILPALSETLPLAR